MSESILINAASAATGSAAFYTHRSDRVIIRAVPTGSGLPTVTIAGVATSLEADTGTLIDAASSVPDTGFLVSMADEPFYKITVTWTALSTGSLSVYTYVGGAS